MSLFHRKDRSEPPAQSLVVRATPAVAVTQADVLALLSGLSTKLREQVTAAMRPAVRYATARLPPGQSLPSGTSKFGGLPDLPAGAAWPTWTQPASSAGPRPLTFFAQLDLARVRQHLDLPLPQDGLLQFYADYDVTGIGEGIFGLYNDELEGARIMHIAAGVPLAPAVGPASVQLIAEAAVAPLLTWTIPVQEDLDDDDYDAFDAAAQQLHAQVAAAAPDGFEVGAAHQLGGHADYIQHPVESEVVQAAYEVSRRNSGFDRKRWDEVSAKTGDWSVLFQFESDNSLDLMFGDVGTLWWAAPTADVAAGRWDTARFNFQCS